MALALRLVRIYLYHFTSGSGDSVQESPRYSPFPSSFSLPATRFLIVGAVVTVLPKRREHTSGYYFFSLPRFTFFCAFPYFFRFLFNFASQTGSKFFLLLFYTGKLAFFSLSSLLTTLRGFRAKIRTYIRPNVFSKPHPSPECADSAGSAAASASRWETHFFCSSPPISRFSIFFPKLLKIFTFSREFRTQNIFSPWTKLFFHFFCQVRRRFVKLGPSRQIRRGLHEVFQRFNLK